MRFGSVETVTASGDEESSIDRYHDGGITAQYKRYKQKYIVANKQEETKLYLRFSEDIAAKQQTGVLYEITDDPSTKATFTLDFSPKYKGGYMVVLSWVERV